MSLQRNLHMCVKTLYVAECGGQCPPLAGDGKYTKPSQARQGSSVDGEALHEAVKWKVGVAICAEQGEGGYM